LLAPGYTETHYSANGQPVTVSPNHTVGSPPSLGAKRDAWRTMKYMELFIVADHTLYRNQNLNLGHTKQRIVEIANYVDKV
ncbi:ADA33 protein, partial [Ramphastos sulfuratus]|nr:ADA33 protein [Ramphastos sulfuratus]NXR08692.1 ADA33 protein [Semnornis frantzii]